MFGVNFYGVKLKGIQMLNSRNLEIKHRYWKRWFGIIFLKQYVIICLLSMSNFNSDTLGPGKNTGNSD